MPVLKPGALAPSDQLWQRHRKKFGSDIIREMCYLKSVITQTVIEVELSGYVNLIFLAK